MSKIIHYFYDDVDIWKKGKASQFRMCYASWLRYCPDYEIKLWHTGMPEFSRILNDSEFVRECYKRKLWAFIADYVRYYALYHYGGIYLDTDIQLVKGLDEFVNKPFFCSIEGDFYKHGNIPEPALIGGQKGHKIFRDILDIYNSDKIFSIEHFIANIVLGNYLNENFNFNSINYPDNLKEKAENYYRQPPSYQLEDYELYRNQQVTKLDGIDAEIYPSEYFCPTWTAFKEKAFTENTVAIHWNQSSWWGNSRAVRRVIALKYKNPFARFCFIHSGRLVRLVTCFIPFEAWRKKIREFASLR